MSTATAISPPTVRASATYGWLPWRAVLWLGLLAALFAAFVMELTIGPVRIALGEILKALFRIHTASPIWTTIVWDLRMPRAITAMTAGAALAAGGLILQTLLRNPLAGPWVLGIPAGARLGVAIVLALEGGPALRNLGGLSRIGDVSLTTGACAGACAVLLLVALISRRVNAITLLIVGLMFQYLAPSLTGMLLHVVTDEQYKAYQAWVGSEFGTTTWPQIRILLPAVAVCLAVAIGLIKSLNSLLLGEQYANTAGANVKLTRILALGSMLGLSGLVTAYCGALTFLDLAVPHLCRGMFRTSDHRILMPAVIVTGGLIGLLADFIVHLPWERHILHIDYVTAILGAPVILWLVLRRRNLGDLA
jgi:iron complex transport system permease protein